MKKYNFILSVLIFLILSNYTVAKDLVTKATFTVNGNCESCKKRIEKAAKTDGVKTAEWNEKTLLLTITFTPTKITVDQIQQHIAKSGHDTEKYKATEEDYNNLPQCCKYVRIK